MDGIPEKQINISLQYVEEKVIVSPVAEKQLVMGASNFTSC